MRGGGGDGKEKEKDDRRSRADEAEMVGEGGGEGGGEGRGLGERGEGQLCVSQAPSWRLYSLHSRGGILWAPPRPCRLTSKLGKEKRWGGVCDQYAVLPF